MGSGNSWPSWVSWAGLGFPHFVAYGWEFANMAGLMGGSGVSLLPSGHRRYASGRSNQHKAPTRPRRAGGQRDPRENNQPKQRDNEQSARTSAKEETPTGRKGGTEATASPHRKEAKKAAAREGRPKNRPETEKPKDRNPARTKDRTTGRPTAEHKNDRTRGEARQRTSAPKTAERRGQRGNTDKATETGQEPADTADRKEGEERNNSDPEAEAEGRGAAGRTGAATTGRGRDGKSAGDHTGTQRRPRDPTRPPAGDHAKPGSKRTEARTEEETTPERKRTDTTNTPKRKKKRNGQTGHPPENTAPPEPTHTVYPTTQQKGTAKTRKKDPAKTPTNTPKTNSPKKKPQSNLLRSATKASNEARYPRLHTIPQRRRFWVFPYPAARRTAPARGSGGRRDEQGQARAGGQGRACSKNEEIGFLPRRRPPC